MRPLIALFFFLSLTATTTAASSVLLTGCASLNFGSSCLIEDVEILPNLHISESGILTNVKTAEECREQCAESPDCQYFTFRVNKMTKAKTCHLKPAPSDALSPIMVARKYDVDSKFSYTSGPKVCGQKCTEGSEVSSGCGASSPSSCGLLGSSVFDHTCAFHWTPFCGNKGYRCCRDCVKDASCCKTRLTGWILKNGKDVQSQWSNVFSSEQCHTFCVKTNGCTHWNYVTSQTMAYVGGACYLKTYEPLNHPQFDQAQTYVTSVIGSVDCLRDYGMVDPSLTSTPAPDGPPIPGTCFESNIDIVDSSLFTKWGLDAKECQKLCQIWPGCRFFVHHGEEQKCMLKYGQSGRTVSGDSNFIVGPRDCPNETPAPPATGCISGDTDIQSETVEEVPANHAAHCSTKCRWFDHCQGWSYFKDRCYIKRSSSPTVSSLGVASGSRICHWPDYGNDRVLTVDDVLPSSYTADGCAHTDKDFSGADLETIGGVDSLEECHRICLDRADCRTLSYTSAERSCRIKWGGDLVERSGVVAMPRLCPCAGDQCSTHNTDGTTPSTLGLSLQSLGKPNEWSVKGDMVNFSSPSSWQRMALLVLTDAKEDCYVSDLIPADKNCWDLRHLYLPLHARVQIIGVASGLKFKGWNEIPWDKQTNDGESTEEKGSSDDGHVEIFNQEVTITEVDKPNSDHGVFIQPIAGSGSSPDAWPEDLTSPLDFQNGKFYARLQSFSTPSPISFRIIFCLTGSDYPVSEICTKPMVVPPFNV